MHMQNTVMKSLIQKGSHFDKLESFLLQLFKLRCAAAGEAKRTQRLTEPSFEIFSLDSLCLQCGLQLDYLF